MAFYKVVGEDLAQAPSVIGPGFSLAFVNKDDAPIDGWYWFDDELLAVLTLQPLRALAIVQQNLPTFLG